MDADAMIDWWVKTATEDAHKCLPKMAEYGANDLVVIGSSLVPGVGDTERAEAGVGFYLLGKASRLTGAYVDGRRPSDDTWLDAATYSMMGRMIREFGGIDVDQ